MHRARPCSAIPSLACLLLALAPACHSGGSPGEDVPAIRIRDEARLRPGPDGDGWILPNGRRIEPLGTTVRVDLHPLNLVLSPDGATVFTISNGEGRHAVTALDAATGRVLSVAEKPRLFLGLAVSRDGRTVYAGGGRDAAAYVFGWDGAALSDEGTLAGEGFHGGLALSPDGRWVLAVDQIDGGLSIFDAETRALLGSVETGANAYAVVLSPDGAEAYVSAERASEVQVFDVRDPRAPRRVATIAVPKNPEGMALSEDGELLYVANADEDAVTVIAARRREVLRVLDLRTLNATGLGTGPNALAFSPDGARLYVAQAADDRVAVVDLRTFRLIGAIPTGWYPVAVAVSPDGRRLYVSNAKGIGAGPDRTPESVGLRNRSTVQLLDLPGDDELGRWVSRIDDMNGRSGRLFEIDRERFESPVPLERGGPTPIEHVIVVVRENKTYDALFGDWPNGDGDPAFCSWCDVTPNLRALAERFASGDNYYSNAESSDQGHVILTTGISNTYHEKVRNTDDRPFSTELDVFANPAVMPKREAIFQAMVRAGIRFRNYGEAIGMLRDNLILDPTYAKLSLVDPPFNWMFSKDVDKLAERIEEWERDGLPPVVFMLFPNDHTLGCEAPYPTPASMVADNDLATGQLVEWLSRSPYWERSLVLIVEDDPQGSDDHVDAHRSIVLAVSPWTRRGYVSPVLYHEGNLLATFEHLVGLEPLSIYDELAQPMWDLFSNEPDPAPFTALPRGHPEEISMPGTNCGLASQGLDFLDVDRIEGLGEILSLHRLEGRVGRGEATSGEEISLRWKALFEQVRSGQGEVWEMQR